MRSSLIMFENLDEDDIAWIHQVCRKLSVAKGEILIDAGTVNRDVYLLLDGRCKVTARDGRALDMLNSGDIMGEISAASNEQSLGVSQVGEAVTQMDQVTQQNAALVEEAAAAAFAAQWARLATLRR